MRPPIGFCVIRTKLGAFGLAWHARGIVRTWLHEGTPERTRLAIRRAIPDAVEQAPPPSIAAAVAGVVALLAGEGRRLDGAELDFDGVPDLDRRVYEVVLAIPPGETRTYGEIARALGEEPMAARDVGQAMARNRYAPIVPCHRVVGAGGQLGGYSAPGGTATKRRLLELEGAAIVAARPRQQLLFGESSADERPVA